MFWERGSLLATASPRSSSRWRARPESAGEGDHAGHPARDPAQRDRRRGPGETAVGRRLARRRPGTRLGAGGRPFGLRTPEKRPRPASVELAVLTGLLAAVIGGAVVTASELAIFGHSVGGSDRSTSVFGGCREPRTRSRAPTPARAETRKPRPPTPPRRRTGARGEGHRGPDADRVRRAVSALGHPADARDRGGPGADALWPKTRSRPRGSPAPRACPAWPRARRRATSAPARRTSRAPRTAAAPRSSAATSRPPSRS